MSTPAVELDLTETEQTEPLSPEQVEEAFQPELVLEVSGEEAEAAPQEPASEEASEETSEQQPSRGQQRIQALAEERDNLRQEMQRQQQQYEQRLQEIVARIPKPQEPGATPPAEIPSFDEDPAAHLLAKTEQTAQTQAEIQQQLQQQQAMAQQEAQLRQVQQQFAAQEQAFTAETPDYYEAAEHLKQNRAQFWANVGLNPQDVQVRLAQEAMQVIQDAQRSGGNPARAFYQEALARGYTPKSAAPEQTVQEQVRQSAQNQQRSPSLGSRGSAKKTVNAEDLLHMSPAEFKKATEGQNWDRLMGGETIDLV